MALLKATSSSTNAPPSSGEGTLPVHGVVGTRGHPVLCDAIALFTCTNCFSLPLLPRL